MDMISFEEIETELAFAKETAQYFAKNVTCYTYTSGEIKSGCLFALRYGLGNDCVVVFKLDKNYNPKNYQQIIREFQKD